ncbi:MAG: exodeoxyribonuclease V subunit gamma [Actinomycetia bacterium]|nr:exodeoxyribonuclease V subunit gamma [Actinomycetes bacterium]
MTLFVHRATSTDLLADALAELLADPLADPFAEEVVAVPAKGVERWLAQRLSHRLGAASADDGVCAGIRFLNPHSLVALVLGVDFSDPWRAEHLAWPVLRAIDDSLDEQWAASLADHLGHHRSDAEGELRRGRRYAVARRLAGLFAEYAAQRPAMLEDWRLGGSGDGIGGPVETDLAWQPHLWRRVLDLVDAEAPEVRAARVVAELRSDGGASRLILPGRLSLFGHTRIARSEIEVIDAIAEHRDVHLWLPQASPAAWDRLVASTESGPVPRADDDSGLLVEHPLLASLGRDARELQRTLAGTGAIDAPVAAPRGPTDAAPTTLLALLQQDIRTDHAPDDADRAHRIIPADDRTIQVHAAHGQSRQVEVLRDVITDLLQRDPDLEPRDILVMCPDVEAYAPLVHAAFGLGGVIREDPSGADPSDAPTTSLHPAHTFRVRIADRSPLQTNPLLALADRLVLLAGSRLTASEVLDLARSAPVRRRFGLGDGDLERITDWVEAVVIRWGLDSEHRGDYRLHELDQNTWRAGLDRILLGAAVDGEEVDHLARTLALDDLDSGDIELAGKIAELIARLGASMAAMKDASTPQQWIEVIRDGVLGIADVPTTEQWQLTQLDHELARIGAAAAAVGGAPLGLSDLHALLDGRGSARATRSGFRTGSLTVCTMVPMRSVPHQVVCLIGLDDGVFPRTATPDGDDALARRPVTGERDARSEDRQLLLDALMSAGHTLVITYAGFDEHTGAPRPPAVPLGELIDTVRRTASGAGVERLLTNHPLQPFDARNLGASGQSEPLLPGERPFSYDPSALRAAERALGDRVLRESPADITLPRTRAETVDLTDLLRFFDNPAREYLRTRLGMTLPEVPEIGSEGIPIELDGLATWAIGDRLLNAVLAGRDPYAACNAELWRGELPPNEMGERLLGEIVQQVQPLVNLAREVAHLAPGTPLPREVLDIDIALPSGRRITGTVPGLVRDRVLHVTYSSVRAKQRLRSWITSLVLAASPLPDGTLAASHVIGREKRGNEHRQVLYTHGGHQGARALELLDDLLDVRDRGLAEPVPLPLKTAHAFAERYLGGHPDEDDAVARARDQWENRGSQAQPIYGESEELSHRRVYGSAVPLTALLGEPRDDEQWEPAVRSRLGQYALRVWGPVLQDGAEEVRRR